MYFSSKCSTGSDVIVDLIPALFVASHAIPHSSAKRGLVEVSPAVFNFYIRAPSMYLPVSPKSGYLDILTTVLGAVQ